MIYALAVFSKDPSSLSDLRISADPTDLLRISADSPYYRFVRHALSVPGILETPSNLVLDNSDEFTAWLLTAPAITWSGFEPSVLSFVLRENLDSAKLPSDRGFNPN